MTAAKAAFDGWPMPARAHVPGTGTVPDRAPLEAVKALMPARIEAAAPEAVHGEAARADMESWPTLAPFRYGVALYSAGYYWEAHEVWEPVWMAAPPQGRARHLLAGLIQLANAGLKLRMGRLGAAARLALLAEEHFAECARSRSPSAATMGLDVEALAAATARFRAAIMATPAAEPERALRTRPHLSLD